MVIILGAVTRILQRYKKNWCKIATAIAGAAISASVVINNTVFDDHRLLNRMANEGRMRVADIRFMILQYDNADEQDRDFLSKEIRVKVKEIYKLDELRFKKVTFASSLFSEAYAQQQRYPARTDELPRDKKKLYFRGGRRQPVSEESSTILLPERTGAGGGLSHLKGRRGNKKTIRCETAL